MKRSHIILFLLFYFNSWGHSQDIYTIKGLMPEEYKGAVLRLTSLSSDFKKLSVILQSSQFQFSGYMTDSYEFVSLTINKNDKQLAGWSFFIGKGKNEIEILPFEEGESSKSIRYICIPFVKEQKHYDSLVQPVAERKRYNFKLLRSVQSGILNNYNEDSLIKIVRDLEREIVLKRLGFISENKGNYFGMYILDKDIIKNSSFVLNNFDINSLCTLFNSFEPSIKKTKLGNSVESYLKKRESLLVGNIVPDFSFYTQNGEQVRLSDFRNKEYVILCFWDSWCAPCIKNIPLFMELNKQFKSNGLTIIFFSMDSNKKKWLGSLEKYKMNWLQTCDLPNYRNGPSVGSLYDIEYIPQYFLIDKKGQLIYHNTQMNDDTYKILVTTIKKILG